MRSTIAELQAFANATYGGRPALLTPFTYNVDFDGIAAAGTEYQQLQIQANADFILTSLNCIFTNAAVGLATTYPLKCLITDNSSGEQFTNAPLHIGTYLTDVGPNVPAVFSNVQSVGVELPYPLFIQGRTSLTVMAQNLMTGTAVVDFAIQFNGVLSRKYSQV